VDNVEGMRQTLAWNSMRKTQDETKVENKVEKKNA
jgi:hypothetical protein